MTSQTSCPAKARSTAMLLHVIESSSWTVPILAICLLAAGLMKGISSIGMPSVAIPLLSTFIDLKASVMLLTVPLIVSNIPQALEGGETLECFVRLIPVLFGMMPGILIGSTVLLTADPTTTKTIAGLVIMFAAALSLLTPRFQLRESMHVPVGMAAGFMGGALGGLAAMSGPLVFVFLLAKGLRGKKFTKEASLFLVLSAVLLVTFLSSSSSFDWRDLAISTLALAPVAIGMFFGRRLRDRIPAETFKKVVLVVVLASGAGLTLKAVLP
jgi:uncharacterized membrane protein YfcA